VATQTSGRDLTVGLFVIAGFAGLAWLSIAVGGLAPGSSGGFELVARFDEIGGLKPRAAVRIAGVKVGQVSSIELNEDHEAVVRLDLARDLHLDVETEASIMTSGLLGDQFVALEPGGADDILRSGEPIGVTHPAMQLERLIGRFVNNTGLEEE
jgi:phospholipid/cholesterol/gamma-HCH transport system substrate-binding protein